MLAGREHLWNLVGIIDRNNIQIDGMTEDIMPLESLRAKYEAFNWHVLEANGHDMLAMNAAIEEAKVIHEKPTMIIAHTIAGQGVGFMERQFPWHSKTFKPEEAKAALAELRTLGGKIKSEHE
ncbi:MAG: transketolase, partial [Patescibacteria group bacterium]